MPSLDSFGMFVKSTGVKVISSPDKILNDAVKNTYLLGRALKGSDAARSIQSGRKIIDRVQLTDVGTAEFFHANEDLDIQNVDSMVSIEIDWRFLADHYSYTQQEVTLNSGDPQTYYKNLLKGKRQSCTTSIYNKMEDAIFAQPSNSDMEAASGKLPYSIPTFITPDGLSASGFTTTATVNRTTETGFRNQVEQYDPTDVTSRTNGLLRSMSRMWHKTRFISPSGGMKEYFESDLLQKMVIVTNLDGIDLLESLTRDMNDRATPANNLGWVAGKAVYAGIPIDYISTLDVALVNSGAAMTSGEPWFYYINFQYLYPIFHTQKYMIEEDPKDHPRQPFSKVVWKQTWYNWFPHSLKRQGLITPSTVSI